jgi:glyoxylase-like metal-dependent hydrolase (beta-lactamase superfamily II)
MRSPTPLLLSALLVPCVAAAQRGPAPDPIVREGATVQLGPHTYAIPDFNVGLVPNVGIVVGERATLVIDPGLGRRNGEAILREVAKVSDNTELYIASTHFHPEHTVGYVAFPASARYVNSTVQEAEFAENGTRMIELFAGRSPLTGELLSDARRRVADITFDREYTLDLGGVTVRMLVVGPTHTAGDTGFFVDGDRVLFAGDVVMNESFVAANQGSSVRAWLAAFDAFEAMGPTTIVPAHGAIGDGALIPTLRTIVEEIRQRALALKAQGRSADQAADAIQAELVARHPGWPRANGIASLARAAWNEGP